MYEKLCAVLDALRERGVICKAEMHGAAGTWNIVGQIEIAPGVYKVFTDPVSIRYFQFHSVETCVADICKEVCG